MNSASDFGNIVYNLIDAELLFANENDRRSDFDIDFELTLSYSAKFFENRNVCHNYRIYISNSLALNDKALSSDN